MNNYKPLKLNAAVLTAAVLMVSICAPAAVSAQDAEPDEPGIVLPPTLLEVEDLQVEEISAVIPEEDIQLLPEIDIPLPQAEEIFLPEERFDIPYPDQLAVVPGGSPVTQRTANIFSEGEIAVGSMSHVRGDLTLYRLGPDPRFDLRFYHDKIDGYGFRSAGSGFYHSEDLLEGSISHTSGEVDISVQAGIAEFSDGLQRIGEYESLTNRQVHGVGEVAYPPAENLLLTGTIDTRYAQQILSSMEPLIHNELSIDSAFGFGWSTRYVDLATSVEYMFLNRQTASHTFDFDISSLFKVSETVNFELVAGVTWLELLSFYFPFSVTGTWQPSDAFAFEAGGGYRIGYPTYGELYNTYSFVDVSDSSIAEYGWFAYADTQARLLGGLFASADIDFSYLENADAVAPTLSQTTGLFALESRRNTADLRTGIDLRYSIEREFDFSLGWDGRFLSDHPFAPSHSLSAGISYSQREDTFGAGLDVSMPLIGGYSYIPQLELNAYYRLAESVRLNLYVLDPLAPFVSGGRMYWTPYEAPGLQVFLGTNISL